MESEYLIRVCVSRRCPGNICRRTCHLRIPMLLGMRLEDYCWDIAHGSEKGIFQSVESDMLAGNVSLGT